MWDPFKILFACAIVLLGARTIAWGEEPKPQSEVFPSPIHETVLDNGLKVFAVPFDSPGLVAYWTVVRAGSRNEVEPGKSGFAHFFEHMMFRGTEKYPQDTYNDILKGLGADSNAFTSDDVTAYHILAPASALERLMEIESDRFMNLKYSVEDFKKEAGAVLGEYNKSTSDPFLIMSEKMRDAAFTTHTYKHTTIGFLKDIKDMPNQYEYSLKFFDRYYRPEGCVLLVVGDVDPDRVFALARRYYGSWERGSFRFEVAPEPEQQTEQRVDLRWPSPTLPYLFIGYHAPAFDPDRIDMPALDLISQLLLSAAAPLYQKLVVEEQVVDLLFGGAEDHRDPFLFQIAARVKDPDRVRYVEERITAALEGIKADLVDAARLDRVKSHLKYAYAMGLDSADHVARNLAHYIQLTGDPRTVNRVYAAYDRITPEQVREVAARYFVTRARTVVTLRHQEGAGKGGR
ncbi:MAG: M16 family metallopeptidase [Acidobacteriota bacterium]